MEEQGSKSKGLQTESAGLSSVRKPVPVAQSPIGSSRVGQFTNGSFGAVCAIDILWIRADVSKGVLNAMHLQLIH